MVHARNMPLVNLEMVELFYRWSVDTAGPLRTCDKGMKYVLIAIEYRIFINVVRAGSTHRSMLNQY